MSAVCGEGNSISLAYRIIRCSKDNPVVNGCNPDDPGYSACGGDLNIPGIVVADPEDGIVVHVVKSTI